MKKTILIGLISAIVLTFFACDGGGSGDPGDNSGGSDPQTVAKPVASPAAGDHLGTQNVTLTCATEGATIRYTLDTTTPTASSAAYTAPIAISQDTTLKAIATKSGWNDSDELTAHYTITPADSARIAAIDELGGEEGISAELYIPTTPGATAELNVIYAPAEGRSVSSPLAALQGTIADALEAKGLTGELAGRDVRIVFAVEDAGIKQDIPLIYVHNLREAMKTLGANKNISVNAAVEKFTPTFDGADWWNYGSATSVTFDRYSDYEDSFSAGIDRINIINGIDITRGSDGKYTIECTRPLKVFRIVWEANEHGGVKPPFEKFGLKLAGGANLVMPAGGWGNVIVSAGQEDEDYPGAVIPFAAVFDIGAYLDALRGLGLHPFLDKDAAGAAPLINHSKVSCGYPNSRNVAQNGIYDFILAYYSPAKDSASDYVELRELLPEFPGSGLTFDGAFKPSDVTSRNIDGVDAENLNRKGEGDAPVDGKPSSYGHGGKPNKDFIGNITIPMAKWMKSEFNISEFKNTNIIGNGDMWDPDKALMSDPIDLSASAAMVNVGLIGDYSGVADLKGNFDGVIDMDGPMSETLWQGTRKGHLNIWGNITRGTGTSGFEVVYVRGAGAQNIRNTASDPVRKTIVLVAAQKYPELPPNAGAPYHYAFLDNGVPKITPTANTSFRGAYPNYVGTDVSGSQNIPSFDEEAWINGAQGPGAAYSSAAKWEQAAFETFLAE